VECFRGVTLVIDTAKLVSTGEVVTVEPSDNIFTELGFNTYDYKDVVSELIDNAIAKRRDDAKLIVTIEIYVDQDNRPIEFIIHDNAKGIPQETLGAAISPAAITQINSLNEHGLGMKQAVAALGRLKYLATKTMGENDARVIAKFAFGDLPTQHGAFDGPSGTEICINQLKAIVSANPTVITRNLGPDLGARYRRFLNPEHKTMDLSIAIKRVGTGDTLYFWEIEEVAPIYFHPGTAKNKPVIMAEEISGTGWKAKLTFGYAPKDAGEYKQLGLEVPKKTHPYDVALSHQGLDIILHDRVVLFHQLYELGIIEARHNDYNTIRGEIDLIEGFSTAITKNTVIQDDHFKECIQTIKEVLKGDKEIKGAKKKYLEIKTYPEQIPEDLLRDRLAVWLANNPVQPRKDIKPEFSVGGLDGHVDILADNEAWELKIDQASALDVYQLFMYMDVGKFEKGFLVAKSFTPGAGFAAEFVSKNHAKKLVLATLDKFPINQPPTQEERDKYY
jgi:hypothetical protein